MELQHYLLTGECPCKLHAAFAAQARHLAYTSTLHSWRDDKWVPYPSQGLRLLLLEEVHVKHQHIGGEKMCHLLSQSCWWPHMLADCRSFVGTCFECQISGGRMHGS